MIPNPNEYMRGTPRWNAIANAQGEAAANAAWQAAIDAYRTQRPLDDSFWSILGGQLANDPLAAPLGSANNLLGNSWASLFRNKWVLLTLAVVLFGALGGFGWLGRKIFK